MNDGIDVKVGITGLQEAQTACLRAAAAMRSSEGLPRLVGDITLALHRYAVANTHVGRYRQTRTGNWRYAREGEGGQGGGSLRASHLVEMPTNPERPVGRIFINPSAVNPLTGRRPEEYGLYEHRRGGEHAFYDKAVAEAQAAGVIDKAAGTFITSVLAEEVALVQ